jgi:aminoglycoside/choline kinase family phosphotransferase
VGESERQALYRQALDQLLVMQRAARGSNGRGSGFDSAFDAEKLDWELAFFVEHFIGACRGVVLSREERAALAEGFDWLVREIASWERVLCHRDYHSRNLMWREGRLYWIDFQDARLGPVTYDLSSLLRDAYVGLPETFIAERALEFWKASGSDEPRASFERRFDLTCVQRNLKALGTFGYQAAVRGKALYLEYVPRTLAHAHRNLTRYRELAGVHAVLDRHLPDYRS